MEIITKELLKETPLCDGQGMLNAAVLAWSRQPLHKCNLKGRWGRKKRWDYWCILCDTHLMAITLTHLDYASLASVDFLEYDGGRYVSTAAVKVFGGDFQMGDTVNTEMHFSSRKLDVRMTPDGDATKISFKAARLGDAPAEGEFHISRPTGHESLNVVIPWSDKQFQFTSKQCGLPTKGGFSWGNRNIHFDTGSWAVLDFGRGIWPWRTTWNWGTTWSYSGDKSIGLNMGGQWTDGTGATENGILLNGRLHKVFEDVLFEYDRNNFMKTWRMHTRDTDMIDLNFVPFYEKAARGDAGLLGAEAHQCFGHYKGVLKVEGQEYALENALGWAEEMRAKW